MKKYLSLLLAVVMVLSLAACGSTPAAEPAAAPTAEPVAEATAEPAAEEPAAAFLAYLQSAEASAEFEKVLFTPLSK